MYIIRVWFPDCSTTSKNMSQHEIRKAFKEQPSKNSLINNNLVLIRSFFALLTSWDSTAQHKSHSLCRCPWWTAPHLQMALWSTSEDSWHYYLCLIKFILYACICYIIYSFIKVLMIHFWSDDEAYFTCPVTSWIILGKKYSSICLQNTWVTYDRFINDYQRFNQYNME